MDLADLIGTRLGPGPWIEVEARSMERYWRALDQPARASEVPLLYLVSLLPALSADFDLGIPTPRASLNYGLNSLAGGAPVEVGDRVRATATVSHAEWLGQPSDSPVQVIRLAAIENQRLEVVLSAETVSRFVF